MPKAKLDKDGKPVLDAEGKPVMEATAEEQLAELNTRLADITKQNEARDIEFKRVQTLNRQLLSKVGSGMNVSDTIRQDGNEPDFSGLDFVNDPNGSVKKVVGAVVENVRREIGGTEAARRQVETLKNQFYSNNPDLKEYEDIVAIQANKLQAEGTYNDDVQGGFAECAKRTRQWLKDKGIKVTDGQQQPPVVLPGSGSNDAKPPVKKGEDVPFDEAKEQADALAEEIKNRGEASGRRTTRTA